MRLNTCKASALRSIASKNFGDSGKNENATIFHKLTSEVHVKKKRHGLYSRMEMLKLQSCGIIMSAKGDIKTHTADNAMLTNAAARAAVEEVWNSLIYE